MNAPGQPLFTFCIERSGKGVISSTTFGQVPIGSKQLRIRQLLMEPSRCPFTIPLQMLKAKVNCLLTIPHPVLETNVSRLKVSICA
jgi:hypothetical protein